jgi:inorganic pyrophosphatase
MEGKLYQEASIANYAEAMNHAFTHKAQEYLSAEKNVVPVIIEVPRGCPNKYEINKDTGMLDLDRVLHSSVYYPGDYGYVPNTLCGDGDPIDVVVLSAYPLVPGCLVFCRIIGVMHMTDNKGEDDKLIGVIDNDPRNKGVEDLSDTSQHVHRQIQNFFSIYKDLEGKNAWAEVSALEGRTAALKAIADSIDMYNEANPVSGEPKVYSKPPDYWHAPILPSKISKPSFEFANMSYPERVSVYIEVPAGYNNKYEFDHASGMLQLDRVLHSSVFYPLDYGFIPQTLCEDGDPLDILVMSTHPLPVGSMVDVRVIGVLDMEDEKGGD